MLAAGLIHSARHEYADRQPNPVADIVVMMNTDLQRAFDILAPRGNTENSASENDENAHRLALIEQARLSRQERQAENAALDIEIANIHNAPHDEVGRTTGASNAERDIARIHATVLRDTIDAYGSDEELRTDMRRDDEPPAGTGTTTGLASTAETATRQDSHLRDAQGIPVQSHTDSLIH